MHHFTRFAIVLAVISFPAFAGAATQAELVAQAEALLAQVAALQAQLGAQGGTIAPTTVTSSAACPLIGRSLKRGSSGDDVTRLQQFLARDISIYPEGQVTGYFGALTEAAVKRWQVRYNIVSSGDAATTGYGVVGPRTAAAISLQCSTSTTIGGTTAGPVGGFIQVSPVSGNAPLSVKVTATVNTANSCTGATYTLDWGDGTAPQLLAAPAGTCAPVVQNYTHLYIYGGVYTVKLSAGQHQTSATVIVSGASQPVTSSLPPETFSASPTSGQVPLAVTFSGLVTGADGGWCSGGCASTLDFGDGATTQIQLPQASNGTQQYSVPHTYATAGTYTARLYQGQAGAGRPTVGSPITISAAVNPATFQYGPLEVTPNVSGNPLAVSATFNIPTSCTGYALSWGDGTSNVTQAHATSCEQTSVVRTFTHQYAAGGSYTISLQRGATLARQDSVSIVISN